MQGTELFLCHAVRRGEDHGVIGDVESAYPPYMRLTQASPVSG